jgi:hypothetical protein
MHVPTEPCSAHARQVSVQAALQQTPSAQNPLSHSVARRQDVPSGWPRMPPPSSLPGESPPISPAPPSTGLSVAVSLLVGVSLDASLVPPIEPPPHDTSSPSAKTHNVRRIRMPPHGS